jgi:hypothetical protein
MIQSPKSKPPPNFGSLFAYSCATSFVFQLRFIFCGDIHDEACFVLCGTMCSDRLLIGEQRSGWWFFQEAIRQGLGLLRANLLRAGTCLLRAGTCLL